MTRENILEPRRLVTGQGWQWIKVGYSLFMKAPLIWIVLMMIWIVAFSALSALPVVGSILSGLLFPVILAGIMAGCRAQELDDELELAHLFAGFKQQTSQLVALGGITLVLQLLIFGVMMMLGASEAVNIMMSTQSPHDPQAAIAVLAEARFALIVGFALFLLVATLMQFSTMLIYFNKVSPIEAIKISTRGVLRNIGPMVAYDIILLLLAILATIPLMLGWLVLIPVIFTSLYVAYRNIFPLPDTPPEETPVSQ